MSGGKSGDGFLGCPDITGLSRDSLKSGGGRRRRCRIF
jgi:hypothetical protein